MRSLIARRSRTTPRADPAPSRAAYRMQRLLLTPAFRFTLRVTLPFVLSMAVVALYMNDDGRRTAVIDGIEDLRNKFETRDEFMVKLMAVDGASAEVEAAIREVAQISLPVSTFDLDLDALRRTVEGLPAVKSASARILQKGVLQIAVDERRPAALWRTREGISVVDREGVLIGQATSRADRADLPVIAGFAADKDVATALELFAIAAPLHDRLRGLVRVGERRWDVVLEPDLRIMLPQDDPAFALERVIALHEVQDVLNRDLAAVDMRLGQRPTLRMNPQAVDEWRKIKDLVVETSNR